VVGFRRYDVCHPPKRYPFVSIFNPAADLASTIQGGWFVYYGDVRVVTSASVPASRPMLRSGEGAAASTQVVTQASRRAELERPSRKHDPASRKRGTSSQRRAPRSTMSCVASHATSMPGRTGCTKSGCPCTPRLETTGLGASAGRRSPTPRSRNNIQAGRSPRHGCLNEINLRPYRTLTLLRPYGPVRHEVLLLIVPGIA
jgi:hypothetical protein